MLFNLCITKASFFDIDIVMKDYEISTKLYDKGDLFPFEIALMLFFNSNISSKMFCSTVGSSMLRHFVLLDTLASHSSCSLT